MSEEPVHFDHPGQGGAHERPGPLDAQARDVPGTRQPVRDREFDVVLYGASGFVGELTAAYLAAHAPADLRWALAGRDSGRLGAVRARLATRVPHAAELPLLTADATDTGALRALAARTRVLASTVGPFLRHGDATVAACAAEGTDYADLTGEPEFVDLTYLRHHERAVRSGARLVHACGFDSLPADLGALFTVGRLPEGVPLKVDGFMRTSGAVSGGTLDSVLTVLGRPVPTARAARERAAVEPPATEGRRVRTPPGVPRYVGELDAWALPFPVLDPYVVQRSARALDRYGPDFRYRHHLSVRRLPVAAGTLLGAAGLVAASQVPAARRALSARIAPGTGPDEARRARSSFAMRFIGEGGGRRVYTEVSGGDPGYDESSRMLGEAALCLALDPLPDVAGQVTTAVAMGEALTARLRAAGLVIREAARR
ncbi:putative Saccharopine dehydrogenase (NAD(+), L-glutamate-forming) [Streptomyces sp. Tu6071]|uniref:saccharopine dehydrogenase family protein n=1 Tax=Streptomyces sp. Tu6071 TaxID=355249 RepID=UPI00020E5211|nr:saccharopine dehydrogenase NADP-binding domain-containing protein [Streptomyces sp. Tu6071]EGJ73124.1 putative Saccharopine dehydrogenase (NAD(+), L-glutamate-forming) [Streptomyces sp. Tu6071]